MPQTATRFITHQERMVNGVRQLVIEDTQSGLRRPFAFPLTMPIPDVINNVTSAFDAPDQSHFDEPIPEFLAELLGMGKSLATGLPQLAGSAIKGVAQSSPIGQLMGQPTIGEEGNPLTSIIGEIADSGVRSWKRTANPDLPLHERIGHGAATLLTPLGAPIAVENMQSMAKEGRTGGIFTESGLLGIDAIPGAAVTNALGARRIPGPKLAETANIPLTFAERGQRFGLLASVRVSQAIQALADAIPGGSGPMRQFAQTQITAAFTEVDRIINSVGSGNAARTGSIDAGSNLQSAIAGAEHGLLERTLTEWNNLPTDAAGMRRVPAGSEIIDPASGRNVSGQAVNPARGQALSVKDLEEIVFAAGNAELGKPFIREFLQKKGRADLWGEIEPLIDNVKRLRLTLDTEVINKLMAAAPEEVGGYLWNLKSPDLEELMAIRNVGETPLFAVEALDDALAVGLRDQLMEASSSGLPRDTRARMLQEPEEILLHTDRGKISASGMSTRLSKSGVDEKLKILADGVGRPELAREIATFADTLQRIQLKGEVRQSAALVLSGVVVGGMTGMLIDVLTGRALSSPGGAATRGIVLPAAIGGISNLIARMLVKQPGAVTKTNQLLDAILRQDVRAAMVLGAELDRMVPINFEAIQQGPQVGGPPQLGPLTPQIGPQ
jgi:hypothetical protein